MTRQIREQLNALIDAGELAAGSLLPSERELANSLKVARNVAQNIREDKEVERIERPAKKAGEQSVALIRTLRLQLYARCGR